MRHALFYLPSIGSRDEIEGRCAGLRRDLYQRMLAELAEQARLADALGYDSIHFTEHHFHVEGFELSDNPVLLDLFVALQTKRIRVGQLGIVLPAQNPIRVAEDIAILDHMSGGRACAGFARGYQRRWVDVLAQQTHGVRGVQPHQHDAIDEANREAFEECYRIVLAAWTEDLLAFDGRYWRIPPGPTPWALESTRRVGAGVEDGVVRRVAVVPKPLQKPHPPLFQPFASSERSIRFCAEEGVTAILPPLHPRLESALFDLYAEVSGRPPGEGVGVLRDVIVAPSDDEAVALWQTSGLYCGAEWFAPFGFARGLLDPETGETPELRAEGLALVGSVDSVCRQLERLRARLPLTWLFHWIYNGLIPHRDVMRSLDLFATEVLPRVGLSLAAAPAPPQPWRHAP
jgi:alkanesulfonate monooxygenase SsuD/methylene tetrahydromethanopterin reductase-like flavin-dependent oxidoreductase (luciferase family)